MAQDRFPTWGGLKSFYALSLTGSAVKAAERLNITASGISHQVKTLEKELGVRLIENIGGKLCLTARGKQYFEGIKTPLLSILQETELVRSKQGRRRVSLTLTPSFASDWLLPLLQDFDSQHPDVELDLVTTTKVVDLARENIDLAIRRGLGGWPGLVAEPLVSEAMVPVVSAQAWKLLRFESIVQALASTRVLINTTIANEWDCFCEARGIASPPAGKRFNLETYELTIQAARDGLGIALGRRPLIDNLLNSGELVAPDGDAGLNLRGYFLVRQEGEMRLDVRRVYGWLLTHRS